MSKKLAGTLELVGVAFLTLAVPVFVLIGMVAVSVMGRY